MRRACSLSSKNIYESLRFWWAISSFLFFAPEEAYSSRIFFRHFFNCMSDTSMGAVDAAEPRQRDSSVGVDVSVEALVHPFHQVLLVEQWVVGSERARRVMETLVVVTQLRLPLGRQELVDVHHLAHGHHEDCTK